MWSQWHLSAHLLVIAATCLTLVLVVCIWTQYKNKLPSAQVKRSHLLCTLSYPRPQSHRHRDHSATTINLWSLGSWWEVSGRWWNWLQRVLHHKLPWDCFGCWSIAASACILHAVLVFGALPCRILADAAMWHFKVAVAVLTTFTLTANIVCLSLTNQQAVGRQVCIFHANYGWALATEAITGAFSKQQPPEASHWGQGIHRSVRGWPGDAPFPSDWWLQRGGTNFTVIDA